MAPAARRRGSSGARGRRSGYLVATVPVPDTGYHGGVSELQWVVSAYTIAFASLILTAGALGDRLGAKRVFMAGFALFTAASLACTLAPNAAILIAARAVQGLGAAILVPNSLALLNHAYPDEKDRGRAIGMWAAGASLALTAGPLAGGALITLVGWRSIFLVNLPIGLGGFWLTWRFASETPVSPRRELDLAGQAAAIAALGALAGALIQGGRLGWTNVFVLAGFCAATLCAALFVVQERRVAQPMLPLSLFANRLFAMTSLVGLLVNVAFYGLIFVLSLYFQEINDYSPFQTGLAFLPIMGVVLPVNLIAPRLAERIGAIATIVIGAVITATACLALLFIRQGTPYPAMLASLWRSAAGWAYSCRRSPRPCSAASIRPAQASPPASSIRPDRPAALSGSPCSGRCSGHATPSFPAAHGTDRVRDFAAYSRRGDLCRRPQPKA